MSFYDWLLKNRWRIDAIGDFARDAFVDADFPRRANDYQEIRTYLQGINPPILEDAFTALYSAWHEYEVYTGARPMARWERYHGYRRPGGMLAHGHTIQQEGFMLGSGAAAD